MIKLLHVEDDADIREIAQLSLSLTGEFEIVQSEDGQAALAQVQTFTPDVILIDMMMPGLTGPETLEEIRKIPHLTDIPAIFMTARTRDEDVAVLRAMPRVDVISKPFDPISLPEEIKTILAKASG